MTPPTKSAEALRLRSQDVLARLQKERGELSEIEADVARKVAEHQISARHLNAAFEKEATLGERVADAVARVGGSWTFVIGMLSVLAAWIALNVALATNAFDPYPFILLNLALSCIAALQAPIIMMSQNRSNARDRAQADSDYRVNLKAELEIVTLHEKVDHLLHGQWERLVELQDIQITLLEQLAAAREERPERDDIHALPGGAHGMPWEAPGPFTDALVAAVGR